jgi:hypothetical protein
MVVEVEEEKGEKGGERKKTVERKAWCNYQAEGFCVSNCLGYMG